MTTTGAPTGTAELDSRNLATNPFY